MVTRDPQQGARLYRQLDQEGAKLVVDGRGFKLQGYEHGNFIGGCLFDEVTPNMKIYKEEIFGAGRWCAPRTTRRRCGSLRARLRQRRRRRPHGRHHRARFRQPRAGRQDLVCVNFAIPVPLAYYTFGGWKRSGFGDQPARAGFGALLHQDQDRHLALADRHQGRRQFVIPTMK